MPNAQSKAALRAAMRINGHDQYNIIGLPVLDCLCERCAGTARTILMELHKDGITCPFCSETDFDKLGLKMHIVLNQCEEYNAIT
jgi:hypothetical protein